MRWRILTLLFCARVGLGLQFQTMASVGDAVSVAFGLSQAGVGLMIGLFMAPGLVLAIPAGLAGRLASDRVLLALGLLTLATGGFLSAGAAQGWQIGLGRVCAGAGFLLCTLYFTKMIADWFEGREIATAMSIFVMSWPLGIAMGQIGHAWLTTSFDWRAPFFAASVYCLIAACAVYGYYKPPPTLAPKTPAARSSLTALEVRLICWSGVAWGAFNGGYIVYLSFGPKMLESLGAPVIAAAGVISVASWLMIFSGALCGWLVDRFGRRTLILGVCLISAAASLMALSLPGGGLGASLLLGLVGMAPAGVIMSLSGEAIGAQKRAVGMGIFFTIYFAFVLAAAPLAGLVLDKTGRVDAALSVGAALFCISLVAVWGFAGLKRSQGAARPAQP
jgi:predicted MFS family arabinose efflux permease